MRIPSILIIAAFYLFQSITGFRFRLKSPRLHYRCFKIQQSKEESEAWRSEILSRGYNPFEWIKLPFLIKRLEVAEATEREARENHLYELKRLEVAEAAERAVREKHIYELKVESKNIMLSREGSDKYKPSPVNREKLNNWQQRGMLIRQAYGGEIVEDFEDLSENELYYLAKSEEKSSFGGYSRVEGDVQTKDCVDSIMKGVVRIEDFNESTTKVIFEYNLTPPKEVAAKVPKMSFPIRPDALLIHGGGDVWLFVESKHKADKQDVYMFVRKMRLVIQYMDQIGYSKIIFHPRE